MPNNISTTQNPYTLHLVPKPSCIERIQAINPGLPSEIAIRCAAMIDSMRAGGRTSPSAEDFMAAAL